MSDSLPPVPPKIVAPVQTGPAPRQAGPAPVKTAFDSAPANTLAARGAAERARVNLQAAVRAVINAQRSLADLNQVIEGDAKAVAIAELEGIGPEVVKKFTKLAEPLAAAFTVIPAF